MKYKDYSPEIWNTIHTSLDAALKSGTKPIAAFDADGTLWDTDLGENFFHYQIDHKLIDLPENPWEFYLQLKKRNNDPRSAYLWLAQINAGQKLSQVREWAQEAIQSVLPDSIFTEQKKLIELFLSKGVEVYVVTASVKWAVEPGAALLGIPADHVIGVETQSPQGIINTEAQRIMTYRQGKVDALLAQTKQEKAFFASGNTMGDFELLNSATVLSLAVSASRSDDPLYKTESELRSQAQAKGWLHHRFV